MRALVTGGSGFVGSHLVRRLVAEEHNVTVLDNNSRGTQARIADLLQDIEFIEGDIRSRDELRPAMRDADLVFHLAAINGTKNFYERPMDVLDVNLQGTRNVVAVANETNVDRVLFTSSSEVYGFPDEFPTSESQTLQIMDSENPRYSYAGSKIVGEQYVVNGAEDVGFDYTVVRPHNLYGPDMGYDHVIPEFIERLVAGKEFTIYGDGTQTRSFCYISDAVECIIDAAMAPTAANEIYNVGTQDEVTINELAERLFDMAETHPEVSHITSKELSGSPDRRQPDIRKARNELNYEPSVSLDEGLERTFDAYCRDIMGVSADEWRSS